MVTIKLAIKNQIIELTIVEARQLQQELTDVIGDSKFPTLSSSNKNNIGINQ